MITGLEDQRRGQGAIGARPEAPPHGEEMLIRYDDLPVHQTSEPLAYLATSDRNAYGRYWFAGYEAAGGFLFQIALGFYPHREVMDCGLSIAFADGRQHNFRASRRLRGDRTDTCVGPFRLTVVEPMRALRVTIDDNSTGVSADLTFRARTVAHDEPADASRQGVRTVIQATRFSQFGAWEGFVDLGGRRIAMTADATFGMRDRSWGWRPMGEPEGGVAKLVPDQLFFAWSLLHWGERCTHYGVVEDAEGRRRKQFAHLYASYPIDSDFDPLSPEGFRLAQAGEHRLTLNPRTRFVERSAYDLIVDGAIETVEIEPGVRFHLMGLGYHHPEWNHGRYHGEEAIVADEWDLNEPAPALLKTPDVISSVAARCGDAVGHGVFQQFFMGPHHRYGNLSVG
jgi:hypothetical protein